MGKHKNTEKFRFDIDFQKNLLQYTITDKYGYKALNLYDDSYFTLIEHAIIAYALKSYYKRNHKIPKNKSVLKEEVRKLFIHRNFKDALKEDDKALVFICVDDITAGPIKDGEAILEECRKFARFVKLREVTEEFDLSAYDQYPVFSSKIQQAINYGKEIDHKRGLFLIEDSKTRQQARAAGGTVIPTPFWQMNRSTNAGGYEKHSVICLIGPQKEFKTGTLINFARKYLTKKKRILYFDLENGEGPIITRVEQSLLRRNKNEILSGNFDPNINKLFRKLKRLGAELYVKRLPSLVTTTNDLQKEVDELYLEYGLKFDMCVLDYIGNLGSLSAKSDDFGRISDATLDFKNFLVYNDYDIGLTAMHVTREAMKRFKTKFEPSDIAKCIDVSRHVDAIWGIQQSDEEALAKVLRMEVIDQRDGMKLSQMYFWLNIEQQRLDEFTRPQLKEYNQQSSGPITPQTPKTRVKSSDVE